MRQELFFGTLGFGHVDDRAKARRAAGVFEIARIDGDENSRPIRYLVAPDLAALALAPLRNEAVEIGAILRKAQIGRRHLHERIARVSVTNHRRVVYREKSQRLNIHQPHRHRIDVEQQLKQLFALLRLGDVFVRGDPSTVRHRPVPYCEYAAVLEFDGGVARFVGDRDRIAPGDVLVRAHRRAATGFEPQVNDLAQGNAGLHTLRRQTVHLDIALVANDEALRSIEETQAL